MTWRSLTADREKLDAYADDEWLRSGLAQAQEALDEDVARVVQRHAVLVLQPDCVAGRTAHRCVDLVRGNGFEPVHTVRFHFGPERTAGVWHYQSTISTRDSLAIADLVCGRSDSLLVLLRDTTPHPTIPASLRLTDLKGRSNPAKRSAHHLRTVLGSPTVLIVLVHTPDEPLDVIRETAVLLGPRAGDLFARMARPLPDDAADVLAAHVEALYAETEAHDLDLAAARRRVGDHLPDAVRRGRAPLDWGRFTEDLVAAGIDPTGWDALLVGSAHVEHDLPGVPRLVDRVSVESWLAGEGVVLPPLW